MRFGIQPVLLDSKIGQIRSAVRNQDLQRLRPKQCNEPGVPQDREAITANRAWSSLSSRNAQYSKCEIQRNPAKACQAYYDGKTSSGGRRKARRC